MVMLLVCARVCVPVIFLYKLTICLVCRAHTGTGTQKGAVLSTPIDLGMINMSSYLAVARTELRKNQFKWSIYILEQYAGHTVTTHQSKTQQNKSNHFTHHHSGTGHCNS